MLQLVSYCKEFKARAKVSIKQYTLMWQLAYCFLICARTEGNLDSFASNNLRDKQKAKTLGPSESVRSYIYHQRDEHLVEGSTEPPDLKELPALRWITTVEQENLLKYPTNIEVDPFGMSVFFSHIHSQLQISLIHHCSQDQRIQFQFSNTLIF